MRKTPKKVWIAVAGVALAGVLMTKCVQFCSSAMFSGDGRSGGY